MQARGEISAAFARGCDVVIDVGGVTETDLTFVQLVESARRKAAETGCALQLTAPAESALLEVLQRGGFLDVRDPDRCKFWLQGAAQ